MKRGLTESDRAALAHKESALREVAGRVFSSGGGVIVREHGIKREVNGYPIARFMATIQGPYTRGRRDGRDILIDKAGNHFDPAGRRIIADKRDEDRAKSQGAVED